MDQIIRRRAPLLTVVLLISACGGAPAASPTAAALASPTPGPSLSPLLPSPAPSETPAPSPTPPVATQAATATQPPVTYPLELDFANQFAMRVNVTGLNVRAKPSTSSASLGHAVKGSIFLVRDWPLQANGFSWYFGYQALIEANGTIPALPKTLEPGVDPQAGWLAAGTATSPFLVPIGARCPTVVNLVNVEAMLDSELLACFGSKAIVLQGTYGCGGCGGVPVGNGSPDWLADPLAFGLLSVNASVRIGPLAVHFAPTGPQPPAVGSIVKVTVHLDDPRATTCRMSETNDAGDAVAINDKVALAWCRAKLVVDSLDVLGTDPSFPLG